MLQQFTEWLLALISKLFSGVWDFLTDLFLALLDALLKGVAEIIAAIPVPDFIQGGMQSFFSGVGGDIVYVLGAVGLPQALAIIGAGFGFRITRKLVTLFQW